MVRFCLPLPCVQKLLRKIHKRIVMLSVTMHQPDPNDSGNIEKEDHRFGLEVSAPLIHA